VLIQLGTKLELSEVTDALLPLEDRNVIILNARLLDLYQSRAALVTFYQ
jgi:hypothetical protein